MTKQEFRNYLSGGIHFLDGATGSNLMLSGMPKGCCAEKWILEHSQPLLALQQGYAQAGSDIIYAPTFQANPIALEKEGLADKTEEINARLIALSRQAAPDCLFARAYPARPGGAARRAANVPAKVKGNYADGKDKEVKPEIVGTVES